MAKKQARPQNELRLWAANFVDAEGDKLRRSAYVLWSRDEARALDRASRAHTTRQFGTGTGVHQTFSGLTRGMKAGSHITEMFSPGAKQDLKMQNLLLETVRIGADVHG